MHQLPTNDKRFADFMQGLRIARDSGVASGRLPPYPVFVDRLFKEMSMVSLPAVIALVGDLTKADPEGKLYGQALMNTLENMDSPDGSAMHAAVGCAGEGGELLDCVKKVYIYGKRWTDADKKTGQTPLENVLEEMGDFRFYYQKLLNMLGITDEDVQAHNYAKLSERYSSGVYTDSHALGRADKVEAGKFEQSHIGQKGAAAAPERQFLGRRKDDLQEGGAQ